MYQESICCVSLTAIQQLEAREGVRVWASAALCSSKQWPGGALLRSCPFRHLVRDRQQQSQQKSSCSDLTKVWVRSLASAVKTCIYVACYITVWCLKMSTTTHF